MSTDAPGLCATRVFLGKFDRGAATCSEHATAHGKLELQVAQIGSETQGAMS